jgi:hypothetical protein
VQRDGEAGGEWLVVGRLGGDAARVLFGDPVVVGEDDGVLAREVMVRRSQRHLGGGRNVAHGGGVEPASSKKREGGVVDPVAGVFPFRGDGFEHVQLSQRRSVASIGNFEHVQNCDSEHVQKAVRYLNVFNIQHSERARP